MTAIWKKMAKVWKTVQKNGKIVSKVSAVQVNFRGKRNVVYHLEQIYKAKTGFKGFI